MKNSTNCTMSILPLSEPYEKMWKSINKETGEERTGSVHVLKATILPADTTVDPSTLKNIELNINVSKTGVAKKNLGDILKLYYMNKEKFDNGESYLETDVYMGPRVNKEGLVSFFSPWINDAQIVTATTEDLPLLKTALDKASAL